MEVRSKPELNLDRAGGDDRQRMPTWRAPESRLHKYIANLQKMAVAERREAEPTTQRRIEVGLADRQATIKLLAESFRQ